MSPPITVMVSPTGETTVATQGFTGGACILASWELERALGLKQQEQMTPEFYQPSTATSETSQQT
jgi:hypothetical protein